MNRLQRIVVVIAVLGSVIGAGLASAQEPPPAPPDRDGITGEIYLGAQPFRPIRPFRPFGQIRPIQIRGFTGRPGLEIMIDTLTETTGLTPGDLREQFRAGLTLAEIIEASGGDVESVASAAVEAAAARIEAAVATGRLTQERADLMLANLDARVNDALNHNLLVQRIGQAVGRGVLELAAEQTGLEPGAIREQVRAGTSLASVLAANGVDVNAFINDIVARADARLNVLVVDGVIAPERAADLLSTFREQVTERINSTPAQDV